MKAFILYRPNSDHERTVIEFEHDFTHNFQSKLELISLDTIEGSDKAELYGVMQYPAVIAVDDEGKLLKFWQGKMPLMNELSYFTHD